MPPSDSTPLVGRAREWSALEAALVAAEAGRGGVVLLRGPAGIGKSRLAREAAEAALQRGFEVGTGLCSDGSWAPAYQPWREALSRVGGDASALLAGADEEADASHGRFHLFEAFTRGIRERARRRSHLLILEDLHWSDLDSLHLLHHSAQRIGDCGLLVVATVRDQDASPDLRSAVEDVAREAQSLVLTGIDEDGVSELARHLLGQDLPSDWAPALTRRSGGNPLFVRELAAVLDLERDADPATSALPPAIGHAIRQRLARLAPETRDVLAAASVVGESFELSLLEALLGESSAALLGTLEEAQRVGVIEQDGLRPDRLRFSHALIRETRYADTPVVRRAAWHAEIARQLEAFGGDDESSLARLAHHHASVVGADSARRAVECWTLASKLALRARAPDHAALHAERALATLPALDEPREKRRLRRCGLLLDLGEIRTHLGRSEAAVSAFREAAELADALDEPRLLAHAAIGLAGRHEAALIVPEDALRWVERGLRMLEAADPLRPALLSASAHIAAYRGDLEQSEERAREALEVAEQHADPSTWAKAAQALHQALGHAAHREERNRLSVRMVRRSEVGPSRRAEFFARQRRLCDRLQAGDLAGADEQLVCMIRLGDLIDHPMYRWHTAIHAAGRELMLGNLERGEAQVFSAFEAGQAAGSRNAQALFAMQFFHLRELQGRLGELIPALRDLVEKNPEAPGLKLTVPLASMTTGPDTLTRLSFERLAAEEFEDVPADENWLDVMTASARLAAYLKDRSRCERLHRAIVPYDGSCVTVSHGHFWTGAVAHYLGLLEDALGEAEAAQAHFSDALRVHRSAGTLPMVASTLQAQGELLGRLDHPSQARSCLAEAGELFRAMGAAPLAERVEAALREVPRIATADLAAPTQSHSFTRDGDHWQVDFEGRRCAVATRKGMADLATLLASPGREIHALDLMYTPGAGPIAEAPAPIGRGPSTLPALDAEARTRYRSRLAELRDLHELAEQRNDLGGRDATREEMEWIEAELRRAAGEEHRGAHGASDFAEKARKAVYNRVRVAIAAIAAEDPSLGRHLQHSIRTGVICVYSPETPQRWNVRS